MHILGLTLTFYLSSSQGLSSLMDLVRQNDSHIMHVVNHTVCVFFILGIYWISGLHSTLQIFVNSSFTRYSTILVVIQPLNFYIKKVTVREKKTSEFFSIKILIENSCFVIVIIKQIRQSVYQYTIPQSQSPVIFLFKKSVELKLCTNDIFKKFTMCPILY